MTRPARKLSILIFAIASSSCAQAPVSETPLNVAPGVTMILPSSAALGRDVDAAQMVAAEKDGQTFTFEGRLQVDKDGLTLAGADMMGRRAMTIRWSGGGLTAETAPWLPQSLPPANVLADLMLMYWPVEVLNAHLQGGRLSVRGNARILTGPAGEVATITPAAPQWNGPASLHNLAWGYNLTIQSVSLTP